MVGETTGGGPNRKRRFLFRRDVAAGLRGRLPLALLGLVVVAAVVAIVFSTISIIHSLAPRRYELRMTIDTVPLRVYLSEEIRKEAARHELDLLLNPEPYGALEALDETDSPSDSKLALVPGGVKAREYPHLRWVATLAIEPLHLMVKAELAGSGFKGLRGKRIALGPPVTASFHVARDVLSFAGLDPTAEPSKGGYIPVIESPDDLYRELQRIETLDEADRADAIRALPDALVFLAPTPSMLGKRLARTAGYQLLPIPFAEAYSLERLNPPGPNGIQVDRSLFSKTNIPPYTYGTDPPSPPEPCTTVGVPLWLVAQNDAGADAIVRLLQAVYDSPLTNMIRPQPLANQVSSFPPHAGTLRFLRRNDPLLNPEDASKLGRFAGGIGALLSGLIAAYGLVRLRKLRRFAAYYHELDRIDLLARGLEIDPDAPDDPAELRSELDARLARLKHDVLQDFAEGGLQGEGLMTGIIALINDTRESLELLTSPRGSAGGDSRAD